MIRKLALLFIILLVAIPVLAREQKPKDTLVIAISKGFQPFTFLNAEGKPAGMFGYLAVMGAKDRQTD